MHIGILGGGQLARMMALSCHSLGVVPYVVNDRALGPCSGIANLLVCDYEDIETIKTFLRDCPVITYEFENIPLELVQGLSGRSIVSPNYLALSTTRERVKEKTFAMDLGILVPEFLFAESPNKLLELSKGSSYPGILKTNSSGYDGKGQWSVESFSDFENLLGEIPNVPLILEKKINFEREFSIIGVRDYQGNVSFYDPCENVHQKGILVKTTVGTIQRDSDVFNVASSYVKLLLEALDYVGVLSVEFFQEGQSILFNEYAPRVHNSGHWTIEGAHCSQFENHIRAVLGLPLGSTESVSPCMMFNLLGTRGMKEALLECPKLHYHWYGKRDVSDRRKVGHLTILGDTIEVLREAEERITDLI